MEGFKIKEIKNSRSTKLIGLQQRLHSGIKFLILVNVLKRFVLLKELFHYIFIRKGDLAKCLIITFISN